MGSILLLIYTSDQNLFPRYSGFPSATLKARQRKNSWADLSSTRHWLCFVYHYEPSDPTSKIRCVWINEWVSESHPLPPPECLKSSQVWSADPQVCITSGLVKKCRFSDPAPNPLNGNLHFYIPRHHWFCHTPVLLQLHCTFRLLIGVYYPPMNLQSRFRSMYCRSV